LLVLVQLAAILVVARVGSEIMKRLGQPAVVGELAAGILVGPTVLGHFFPGVFAHLFPPEAEQYHLLEIISWLGMVMLLMLTGIETDVRLLKNLGRSAVAASLFGMAVPFVFGLGLGLWMPARYVAAPAHQTLFALFLATAMSISAMPVIAKILLDLDLTRRNIGVVILSAGVVDDTCGWLILSLIAGAAGGSGGVGHLVFALAGTLVFVAAAAFVLYPVLRPAFRIAAHRFQSRDTDLVLMLVVTLLCAAATDAIGVHAVFGAFVAGCVIRQVPHLRPEILHKLESVVFSVFAPVFFGAVGLKVDLWKLSSGRMLALVLIVATAGKLVGCSVGSLLGGLRFWESVSIAVAMNARGAMELVVATIGLSLGILNQEMYSIVVMVAVVTSFMAPLLLRVTVRMVRMTEEEAARISADEARGLFDPARLRVLVPTAGGPNALVAARIALALARSSAHAVSILYVDRASSRLDWLRRRFRPSEAGQNLDLHLERIKGFATTSAPHPPELRKQVSRDPVLPIREEAARDYDVVLLGASGARQGIGGEMVEKLVDTIPCHLGIVKHRGDPGRPLARLLVPIDGSFFSRVAIEFAVRYAEGAGDEASVTIAYVAEAARASAANALDADGSLSAMIALSKDGGLEKVSPVFKATKIKTSIIVLEADRDRPPVLSEAMSDKYDMVVLGAENRAVHHRLFFGHENERLVEESAITVVMVVPKLSPSTAH
jgi:Kef-type K+ transport system membrane component KefB/nucleotide-binding universal stress UspA family protein